MPDTPGREWKKCDRIFTPKALNYDSVRRFWTATSHGSNPRLLGSEMPDLSGDETKFGRGFEDFLTLPNRPP